MTYLDKFTLQRCTVAYNSKEYDSCPVPIKECTDSKRNQGKCKRETSKISRVCVECGKKFRAPIPAEYVYKQKYKNKLLYFCSWKCMCSNRKKRAKR